MNNLRKALQHFTGMKMAAAAAIQDQPTEKPLTLGFPTKTSPASDCCKENGHVSFCDLHKMYAACCAYIYSICLDVYEYNIYIQRYV